jgi:hypothetical protein
MSKLHRRGYLAISTIAAASALLVVAPAGASAAEAPGDGSTSAETVTEPSGGSSQPAAPPATEWAPQGADTETSSGRNPPLEQGSSVGSGAVTEKAGSDSEKPSYTPDSSGPYEAEPSTPSTFDEPASAPRAGSGVHSVQPAATTTAARPSRPVDVSVGGAISVGHSASLRGDGISAAPPAAAASLVESSDGGSTSSFALPLLAVVALALILGFAGVRLRRRRRRSRLEALWREQDAAWEAAVLRFEPGQVSAVPEPRAQPLQRASAA